MENKFLYSLSRKIIKMKLRKKGSVDDRKTNTLCTERFISKAKECEKNKNIFIFFSWVIEDNKCCEHLAQGDV